MLFRHAGIIFFFLCFIDTDIYNLHIIIINTCISCIKIDTLHKLGQNKQAIFSDKTLYIYLNKMAISLKTSIPEDHSNVGPTQNGRISHN